MTTLTRTHEVRLTKSQESGAIKTGLAGLGGVDSHNGVTRSCNKCSKFFTQANLLSTSHPLLRTLCVDCAPRFSNLMSKKQVVKLVRLQEGKAASNQA